MHDTNFCLADWNVKISFEKRRLSSSFEFKVFFNFTMPMIIATGFWHIHCLLQWFLILRKKHTVCLLWLRYFKALFQLFQNYEKYVALPFKNIYCVRSYLTRQWALGCDPTKHLDTCLKLVTCMHKSRCIFKCSIGS